jgi:threonine dehydratase
VSVPDVATSSPPKVNEEQSSAPARAKAISEVTPASIRTAFERIKQNVVFTPLYRDRFYSKLCGCEVYLKFDNIQKTGSFKVRLCYICLIFARLEGQRTWC